MDKIDLHSIQNKGIAPIVKSIPIQKPIPKREQTIGDILKTIPTQKPMKKPIAKPMKQKPIKQKPIQESIPDGFDRMKQIKVLELYRMEFPKKLESYSHKNFNKCSDEELLELRKQFDYSVNTNSNIAVGMTMAEKALVLYEYIGKNFAGLEIDGITEISKQEEWKDNVKALCLKYMSSPITNVSPENKLAFMIISNSIMLHQINSANKEAGNAPEIKTNIEQTPQQVPKPIIDPIVQKLQLNNINSNRKYEDL